MYLFAGISLKLVMYFLMTIFIYRTRSSINTMDFNGIKSNFNILKWIVYLNLIVSYLVFIGKMASHSNDHFKHISVNLALLSIVFVHIQQLNKTLDDGATMPVAVETIATRFQPIETLGYLLVAFNYLSTIVSVVFKTGKSFKY